MESAPPSPAASVSPEPSSSSSSLIPASFPSGAGADAGAGAVLGDVPIFEGGTGNSFVVGSLFSSFSPVVAGFEPRGYRPLLLLLLPPALVVVVEEGGPALPPLAAPAPAPLGAPPPFCSCRAGGKVAGLDPDPDPDLCAVVLSLSLLPLTAAASLEAAAAAAGVSPQTAATSSPTHGRSASGSSSSQKSFATILDSLDPRISQNTVRVWVHVSGEQACQSPNPPWTVTSTPSERSAGGWGPRPLLWSGEEEPRCLARGGEVMEALPRRDGDCGGGGRRCCS